MIKVLFIYILLVTILLNITELPKIIGMILEDAFNVRAMAGGFAGSAIVIGIKRGLFSNEAGMGSAPNASASAEVDHPVKQGLYGIFEVFVDTIVICTLTGLTLLVSGIDLNYGVKGTTALNMQAFATVMGDKLAAVVIGVGIALFALSTILSWALYGGRCVEFMLGNKARKVYLWIFVVICVVGATMDLGLAWDIADTLNGLMAIPNLIALIGLSGVVVSVTKDYFSKKTN